MNPKTKTENITGTLTDDIDRLSSLPDCVLLHLLSFLPTKWAARTSTLSKRWRDVFLDVPKIELDDSPSLQTPAGNSLSYSPPIGRQDDAEFTRFVTRRLMLRSPAVNEFRLKCQTFSKGSPIDVWLENLLGRGIKAIEIQQVVDKVFSNHPLHLPRALFQSKTLVVLKLQGGSFSFDSIKFACFPNLKVLSMEFLSFKSEALRFSDQGYPVLEDLSLEDLYCTADHKIPIEISSRTVKRLKLIHLNPIYFTRIDADTPHLQDLTCGCIGILLSFRKCETLESAKFYLDSASFEGMALLETLNTINTVKVLHIMVMDEIITEEFMYCLRARLPQFPYLFHLKVESRSESTRFSRSFLYLLLYRHAPNLRTIFCDMDVFVIIMGIVVNTVRLLPLCFRRCLEEINLDGFRGTDAQVALVELLLREGKPVLRSIVLDSKNIGSCSVNIPTMKRLIDMGKLNPDCEVKFI